MSLVTTTRAARPLTRADLDAMPDDSYRRELVDGVLIVTPAPSPRHQTAALELAVLLRAACPRDLRVFMAPLDVVLADDTVLEPDVLVARRIEVGPHDLPTAPVLAVEILSPSTRRYDLTLKRDRYEAAGVASYWVIDPMDPSIRAWDLIDGAYVEVANTTGKWMAKLPFPVTVDPPVLVAD